MTHRLRTSGIGHNECSIPETGLEGVLESLSMLEEADSHAQAFFLTIIRKQAKVCAQDMPFLK